MRGRFLTWGGNCLLIVSAVGLTLGGFEVALRLFLPQKLYRFPQGLFREDSELTYTLNPGFDGALHNPEYSTHVRINSLGLRGPELEASNSTTLRILGIGDSFMSAFNVEEGDTFLSSVGQSLTNGLPSRSIEVVNAGVPGYGTWHELRMLKRLAPVLKPDIVVLGIYLGNDLQNNLNPQESKVRNGVLVDRRPSMGLIPYSVRTWLQRNSMAYVFFWSSWNRVRPWFGKSTSDPMGQERNVFSLKRIRSIELAYDQTKSLLSDLHEEQGRLGIPILAVLIPTEYQVYPRHFREMVEQQGLEIREFDLELPIRRWKQLCDEVGLTVVDLLPSFRSRAVGTQLYMSLDGHLSVEGNRLAGQDIGDAILHLLSSPEAKENL